MVIRSDPSGTWALFQALLSSEVWRINSLVSYSRRSSLIRQVDHECSDHDMVCAGRIGGKRLIDWRGTASHLRECQPSGSTAHATETGVSRCWCIRGSFETRPLRNSWQSPRCLKMKSGVREGLRVRNGDKHHKLSRGDASVLQLAGVPEEFLIKMTDRRTSFDVRPSEDSGSC
jgi:hypothetical protein